MPKVSPLQSNFSGGEFGPFLVGRVDLDRYRTGLETCLNYVATTQGPATRRPGTVFVAEVKDSSKSTRLVAFEFSITQAYIIEFGDGYLRFYKDRAQILSGPAYEVVAPWAEADLFQLKFVQSADVLYVVHPDYAPYKITRTGHTAWTVTKITFVDGPYMPTNTTTTTLTPSATGPGAITLTASATTGINGGSGFQNTDVGRLVRLKTGATWGYGTITGYTSTTVVTLTIPAGYALPAAAATTNWRLGIWSDTTGYPAATTFHEDRLVFGGTPDFPQRIDASNVGDYEVFSPTDLDGTVADNRSWAFTLNSDDVNVDRWLRSDERALLAGTVAGEWVIRPSSLSEAITPTNVTAKQPTNYGSADIQPLKLGKTVFFIQRSGKRARELRYAYDVDGFLADDLTILSNHILESGVKEMAYQKEPYSIGWIARNDGVLVGVSYERDLDSLRVGWHRHIIGGVSDAAGTHAKVESVAVIPSSDGTRDELWMIVKRHINGSVKRYVEVMEKYFEDEVELRDAFFVDSGLSYDSPLPITAIALGANITITSAAHGLSDGDVILIDGILGTTELNGNDYVVSNVTANTFRLKDSLGAYIDGTTYTLYVSGGEIRKYVSSFSGLGHLEGETVSILADGAPRPDEVVSGGAITLNDPATTVQIGLGYKSQLKQLRIEAGSADGTALGKTRRAHRIGILFHRSVGLNIGYDFDNLTPIIFRQSSDPISRAVPLFTGIKSETVDGNYDFQNQLCVEQNQPLPSTILAIMPQMYTEDRG